MSLITPERLDNHEVYSEEGFFYYWNAPSIAWEELITANFSQKYLIIPINWPIHLVDNSYDFGKKRKELNISKLIDLGHANAKKVLLVFSISPNPIFSNSGIPTSFARQIAYNESGILSHTFCGEKLVKHYSFFDSSLFKGFSEFISSASINFSEMTSKFQAITCEVGWLESGVYNSFFDDYGQCFHQSFEKYLDSIEDSNYKHKKVKDHQKDFRSFVKSLYFKEVQRNFSKNFIGHQRLSFINGSEKNSLISLFSTTDNFSLGQEIVDTYSNELIPISFSIDKNGRNEIFSTQLKQLFTADFLDQSLEGFRVKEDAVDFLPISFFHFIGKNQDLSNWIEAGIFTILKQNYNGVFSSRSNTLEYFRDSYLLNKILLISGEKLSKKDFLIMKDFFYTGSIILFDSTNIDDDANLFLIEFLSQNGVKKEVLHIGLNITVYTYQNSSMLVFNLEEFFQKENKREIWKKILSSLPIIHFDPKIKNEGIVSCWRSRLAKPFEMNFDEVRRLSIYNVTDYKKEISFELLEHFFLLKTVDQQNVEMVKSDKKIKITFSPKSSLSLDFGIVYDR